MSRKHRALPWLGRSFVYRLDFIHDIRPCRHCGINRARVELLIENYQINKQTNKQTNKRKHSQIEKTPQNLVNFLRQWHIRLYFASVYFHKKWYFCENYLLIRLHEDSFLQIRSSEIFPGDLTSRTGAKLAKTSPRENLHTEGIA